MRGHHGRYRVVGKREYMGVKPGREFVAQIPSAMEQRAITRGDIVKLESVVPAIDPARATFPKGWLE